MEHATKKNAGLAPVWRVALTAFLSLLAFDVVWCLDTTFRAFSDPLLYINLAAASLALTVPYALTRRLWVEALVLTAVDVWLICNVMYCRTYFTAIPIDSYLLAGNLRDFLPSVADSVRIADGLILLVSWTGLGLAGRRPGGCPLRSYWWALGVSAAVAVAANLTLKGGFDANYTRMKESCYYSTCTTPVYTVAGDLIHEAANRRAAPTQADIASIDSWLAEHRRLMPYTALHDSVAARENVVLIICESLESWVLERIIDGVEITPRLNRLIADSATFYAPNIVTQVGNGRSIDCQLLVNTGLLPMKHSVFSMKYPGNTYPTLNRAFAARHGDKARSYILSCDKPVTWNQKPVADAFGYDTLLHKSSWRNDELVGNPPKLSDGSFVRQIIAKMRDGEVWPQGEKAFIEIITYSGHNPFRLPERLRQVEFDSRYPERMRDYMTMANYTDQAVGQLVDYIKSRPDGPQTMIVVMGDHEGLASSRSELLRESAARGIVSEKQLTPFIVVNGPVGGRHERFAGQVDLYTTLLQMLRLDGYGWKGMGASLLDPSHPGYAIVTMTQEAVGDTAGVAPAVRTHMARGADVSDRIIGFDYFAADTAVIPARIP